MLSDEISQVAATGLMLFRTISGRTGMLLTRISGLFDRSASTTASATCPGVQLPRLPGASRPLRANIPEPVTKPGQMVVAVVDVLYLLFA